jgi:membrane protein implicated in regulation of membrane protease activity
MDLLDMLSQIAPAHWFAIGLGLLVLEIVTGTTYLLWPAAAAALTGLFAFATPAEVPVQWAVFAVLTVALTLLGHFYVRGRILKPRGGDDTLNERASALIGQVALAEAPFEAGHGQVKLNDTIWRAASGEAIVAGEKVQVVSVDGALLRVKRHAL